MPQSSYRSESEPQTGSATPIDITPAFTRAIAAKGSWGGEQCEKVARALARKIRRARLHWSKTAGDSWARVMIGKCGCAIICRYVPLVLLHFDYIHLVDEVSHLGAIPLVIKTWDKHYYALSRDCIAEVFDHWANDIDPDCFTMNDLYFATV